MSHLGFIERRVPYPLRAARLGVSFTLFPWWIPSFRHTGISESAKRDGNVIWYGRWLFVQIEYRRWA